MNTATTKTPGVGFSGGFVSLPRDEAQTLLDDLNARIDHADPRSVPVFPGISALHNALAVSDDRMGVTGNAVLLLGYVAGSIGRADEPTYEVESADAASGCQVVRHILSGNTYRISVVQLDGVE